MWFCLGTLLLLALGVTTAFVAFGDALLTFLLRKYASQYVGDRILLFWSLRDGVLEINNIALAKDVLPALEPMIGLPMDLEKLELQQFAIELPLWNRFVMRTTGNKGMQSRIHIAGLQIGLALNKAEKWIWTREENLERFRQAVENAAKARLARVDSWTATIVQKLQQLADARQAIREAKKKKANGQASSAASESVAKPAFWHELIDEIIDSFAIVVRRFVVTIRDDYSASGIGITFEKFEVGRSHACEMRRKRIVELNEFEIFANPRSRSRSDACYIIRPFSMAIGVYMPYIFQGLLMQLGNAQRALELEILFSSDQPFVMQLRPAQVTFLMSLLHPIQFYYDWCNRACVQDDIACVELEEVEAIEYNSLYKEQWRLDHETNFFKRLHTNYKLKKEILARRARLVELEANVLAFRILDLRSQALGWRIPRSGTPLPYTALDLRRRAELRKFLQSPLEKYEKELPDVPPMFHTFSLTFVMPDMKMQLMEDSDKSMMVFFVNDFKLELHYSLAKVADDEKAMVVNLEIVRFGLLDERNVPSNVFYQLIDRNPDATAMLTLKVFQLGNSHMDVALELKNFSVLVVFDPLISVMHVFLPAVSADEATQMRFLAYDTLSPPQSPEQRELSTPVYVDDLPQEYSPLLLGGMSLNCSVLMTSVEICLLGDSVSLKTHVLAFTSDTKLQIASSARHEGIELELVDVALQPCTIVLQSDGIGLDLAGLRTILELEGEGVDLELVYKLSVGDSRTKSSNSSSSSSSVTASNKTGSKLWGIARAGALKKNNIAEVEHSELQKAEEIAVHTAKRERVKAGAKRKVVMRMSDFALNLSPNDLGVFLSILSSLNDSMKEDANVVKMRDEREARIQKAKKDLEEKRYLGQLKAEFKLRDTDGGGSLDVAEIESLLKCVANCQNLTKDEFDETVREFVSIVDNDGSGDISLEEFESALNRNKIIYPRLHCGVVALIGQEYVDPSMERSKVPYLTGDHANTMANISALSAFWTRYEEQVGATKKTLNGMTPMTVQQKMVRVFKNYEYAQEAWYRLVNPSLIKVGEQSPWLLTKEMSMGSRGNVIDQLLSSFDPNGNQAASNATSSAPELRMFVHTVISTAFGGFYFRLLDDMLPLGLPALEVSLEELAVYGNFSMWEGEAVDASSDVRAHKRAKNNFGVGKISFDVYGKYYNTKARQIEPFLEYYQGVLDLKKDPDSHVDIVYTSDRYLQLNVTAAFMETLNSNLASFSKVEGSAERVRPHIKEEGGLFWMLNESGVNLKYYVVAKKETKERHLAETVTAVVSVPSGEAHPCVLLNVDEELQDYEQQSLKEKQLRQAFRNADKDGSGELDTEEVRAVLREVYEEEERQRHPRSSGYSRSESALSSEENLDRAVEDFIALADTDESGLVSWEEFKIAISKSRETVDRYISIEVEGFQTIHNVPLISIGHAQVYELIPHFEDIETETSIAFLYAQGVELLNKIEKPSRRELQRAFACLRRVKEMDPSYEWIDSYYQECMRTYLPVLLAVHVLVDGSYGLQVKITSAEYIRNDTAKKTECLLVDENGAVAHQNPEQNDGRERFCVLPPHGSMSIPINLVDAGSFAIRQVGETEWSNFLPLSTREQRLYKKLTRYEQQQAQKVQHENGGSSSSMSMTKMVKEKMGSDVPLPNPNEYVSAGTEVVYPSLSCIDNQPTSVIEKISSNNMQLGIWYLVIQPQLVLHNVLPCGVEYAIVQPEDCPKDSLDSHGEFQIVSSNSSSKRARAVKALGQVDYFEFVNEVNSRRMYVESGKSVQIFGLNLDVPALMKMRVCASASNRAGRWSTPFYVGLNADRAAFSKEVFELRFDEGPSIVYQQEWQGNTARSIFLYAPYWIQNRSGLDLKFKLPKGSMCTVEEHRAYFNGDKDVPMLVNGPLAKAMLSVKPFQETPRAYESDLLASQKTKKYLPKFEKVDWSEPKDIASVGTYGELRPSGSGDFSFILAYEVRAAPSQFFRSKIVTISPRYTIVNKVHRSLQVTPVLLDKKLKASTSKLSTENVNCSLKKDEAAVVYTFVGKEKHWTGFRLRDMVRDGVWKEMGDWSPNVPIKGVDEPHKTNDDFNVWTRGPLGDGPMVNIAVHMNDQTIFATLKDVSAKPSYRIENRSTRHSFRYVQRGVKDAEELILKPLESHSFVWDDPLAEALQVKITPLQWKVPTIVDFMLLGEINNVTPNDIYGEVYIDGSTRVLAIGDTRVFSSVRQQAFLNDWLSNALIDLAIHGVGITIVDTHPQEVLNITMESLRFTSSAGSRTCVFTLHHIQMDDMTPHALYPVILAPLDSGFNSDKREGWLPSEDERPFFSLTMDTAPQTGIAIFNNFDMVVNSLSVKLNLEYVLGLVNLLLEFIPGSDEETMIQQGIDYKNTMLTLNVSLPDENVQAGMLLYFKKWKLSPFDFHLVFDSSQEDRGEGISSILGSTLGSIIGGIAHVTPEFHFGEIVYKNTFFYEYDLIYDVVWKIVLAVIGQWYKIVGSVEMLGDPVGLATEIVDGFALAGRQLKRDIRGQSLRKGQSAVTLVQTVFGAPFGSIGKVSNGLGDVVKKATKFKSQESDEEPRHVPEGILHGGVVFSKSIAYGVTGFVKEPVRGAKRDGVKGFAKGVGRGTLQLIVSPVVGTLGVVEKVAQSVSNTTHLMDEKRFDGGRRPARDLVMAPLKPLADSNVITEIEVHCVYIDGLPENVNAQVVVNVYSQGGSGPTKELGKYKSTTLRNHKGTPKFDQSWLIGITSLDTFIDINVFHKRKPLPKKLLGYIRFSVEDIYRDFEAVPAKLLSDTKAKMRLKRRKRVRGSIISELARASSQPVEVRDDSWKQKIRQTSSSMLPDEVEDDSESDSYEDDVEMLSNRSITVSDEYPPTPVAFELLDCASNAKMFLSVRYVNDMRRYA
ncbi:Dynein assembly factor 1, partial [Globisporangium splendens]